LVPAVAGEKVAVMARLDLHPVDFDDSRPEAEAGVPGALVC